MTINDNAGVVVTDVTLSYHFEPDDLQRISRAAHGLVRAPTQAELETFCRDAIIVALSRLD